MSWALTRDLIVAEWLANPPRTGRCPVCFRRKRLRRDLTMQPHLRKAYQTLLPESCPGVGRATLDLIWGRSDLRKHRTPPNG